MSAGYTQITTTNTATKSSTRGWGQTTSTSWLPQASVATSSVSGSAPCAAVCTTQTSISTPVSHQRTRKYNVVLYNFVIYKRKHNLEKNIWLQAGIEPVSFAQKRRVLIHCAKAPTTFWNEEESFYEIKREIPVQILQPDLFSLEH